MKRSIEQSFHDCDQYVQLDMMPEQRYQIVTCSKTGKYERDDFFAICPARHIKFIGVKVMIFNKTAAHENDYSFNN